MIRKPLAKDSNTVKSYISNKTKDLLNRFKTIGQSQIRLYKLQ